MKAIKTGNRVIVIPGIAPVSDTANFRSPIEQQSTARRIVVIKDGKSVGRRRGR
jgi:hypothetical protein